MIYETRDYQEGGIVKGVYFFNHDTESSALIVAPTGSGKSLYIANIADRLSGDVLVLQPSKEILEQNYAKFVHYGGHAGVYSASAGRKDIARVTFATPVSVKNALSKFSHITQVIIDECHLMSDPKSGIMKDILDSLNNPKILGLTATPFRMSYVMGGSMLKFLTRTNPKMFNKLIHYTQIDELNKRGYLSKLRYFNVHKGFDRSKLKVNSTGSDFDEGSLREYYDTINFKHDIVDIVKRINAQGRRVLCFTSFVSDAEYVSRQLPNSAFVCGKTKQKDRDRIINDFRNNKLDSLINVGVALVGFDDPELPAIVGARPTRSLALYSQLVGRGSRIHPNKEDCWIVDMVQNHAAFGSVENLRVEMEGKHNNLPYIKGSKGKLTGVLLPNSDNYSPEKTEFQEKIYSLR